MDVNPTIEQDITVANGNDYKEYSFQRRRY
jgi:hypothetical protein